MEQFIIFLNKFGFFSESQLSHITSKATKIQLNKEDHFIESGKVLKQVGFLLEGIFRIYYYNDKGQEITKIFLEENHLISNLKESVSTEYIQAATTCQLLVFSNKDWNEILLEIPQLEHVIQEINRQALVEKLKRVSPLIAQDATTRYLEFLQKYPTLVNRIPLSYIASYLGITQQSLSRIRKNI
ncbi:Crp/Fnr family transcriptional regulator [Elizabethkingia anophelis]|uniref:Crp/Fnr family transcriptional regulator n=1 Tax=Elizabethkingia anophelis TaxID=1117645 RepID=UPI0004E3F51F|nr:Crp/Fnr family transcriptional regulator [Elizabethkingia anophelis]KFC34528.1 cyclic nucleotide-binding protein [Elizabethkingia anophelis]MCT3733211.1 Crp/Fnr family transcriptional regulator [Elizabethkingia anophelis]MCT3786063.1 Crp/Fnr family transcriptional regulator [Elizabethkingia anophelis]MDV3499986.1 Crp/Fnr family transcriptional regulator [Elizabethkingia anophelis]PKR30507.1 Crp/Fnr family transcriptional regulator [Elizabethkingia anophelis]